MWANTKYSLQVLKSNNVINSGFYPVVDLPAIVSYIQAKAPHFDKEALTDYLLAFKEGRSLTVNPKTILKEFTSQNNNAYLALGKDGQSGDYCNWANHESALIYLSSRYPDFLFSLKASWQVGEQQGHWVKNFLAGQIVNLPTLSRA